jgi:flagellar biogenesis protein FliO
MLNPLFLLPLAFSIESVSTTHRADSMIVEMRTSEPVAARQVRGLRGPHRLYLFVNDGDASGISKQDGRVQVLQRSRYAKVEVVLPEGVACQEPALIEPTADGFRARYSCAGGSAKEADAPAELPAPRTQAREILQAALALPENQAYHGETGEAPEATPVRAETPRAAQPQPAPQATAPAAAQATPPAPPRAEPKPEPVVRPTPEPVVQAAPVPLPKVAAPKIEDTHPVTPESVAAPTPAATISTKSSGLSIAAPAILLLALAAGAYALNRRRVRRQGIIQILETASIGPKRSLLVARVDGRTMVLGASEAGISLLQSLDGRSAVEATPVPSRAISAPVASADAVASLTAALAASPAAPETAPEAVIRENAPVPTEPATADEPENEGGLLRRLFARAVRPAQPAPDFHSLLDESYEDQELRRKLAQGLSARVS